MPPLPAIPADPLRVLGFPFEAAPGDWNMAADEWMLARAVDARETTLRFYAWNRPTVSLGYFQKIEDLPSELSGLPVVRRLSGGGAIIHDNELTYSLALPASHPLATNPQQVYSLAHSAIRDALRLLGVVIEFRGQTQSELADRYLCFFRGDSFDLVVRPRETVAGRPAIAGPMKVVGSAQRRRKGSVLQHGSVLLRQSLAAPAFPGLRELCGLEASPASLAAVFLEPFLAFLRTPHPRGENGDGPVHDPTHAHASTPASVPTIIKLRAEELTEIESRRDAVRLAEGDPLF